MQLEPHSGTESYKKEFQFNLSSVEEQEDEQYYKINVIIDKKIIYNNLQYKIK